MVAGIEVLMGVAAVLSLGILSRVARINEVIAPCARALRAGYLSYAISAAVPVILPGAC